MEEKRVKSRFINIELIFPQSVRHDLQEKGQFSINDVVIIVHIHLKQNKKKRELQFTLPTVYKKIYLTIIIDLNIKPKIIELLLEHIGENLYDTELAKDFFI